LQTLCQNVTFFYELFNFYYICNFFEDQWPVFFTTTFAWEICHAMDGFIFVLFHFRWSQFGKTQINAVPTTVVSGKHPSHPGEQHGITVCLPNYTFKHMETHEDIKISSKFCHQRLGLGEAHLYTGDDDVPVAYTLNPFMMYYSPKKIEFKK
ncbi:hypothetical protein COOONC_23167, partial [Cooperia oncophora]